MQSALLFTMLVGNRDTQLVIVAVITNESGKGWKQFQVLFEIVLEYFMQLARFGRLFPAAGRHIYTAQWPYNRKLRSKAKGDRAVVS